MARKPQVDKRTGANVTPERKQELKEIQARRRQRLTEAANLAGFDTIDKLAAAILSGEVTITKKQ
jgi:hypothetical protein